ncbi:MAG: hypothetical protein AAF502_25520, partial [Bacteroidota bacterium]
MIDLKMVYISLIISAIIGVLVRWLLRGILPDKPSSSKHFVAGVIAIIAFVVLLQTFETSNKDPIPNQVNVLKQEGTIYVSQSGDYEVFYQF